MSLWASEPLPTEIWEQCHLFTPAETNVLKKLLPPTAWQLNKVRGIYLFLCSARSFLLRLFIFTTMACPLTEQHRFLLVYSQCQPPSPTFPASIPIFSNQGLILHPVTLVPAQWHYIPKTVILISSSVTRPLITVWMITNSSLFKRSTTQQNVIFTVPSTSASSGTLQAIHRILLYSVKRCLYQLFSKHALLHLCKGGVGTEERMLTVLLSPGSCLGWGCHQGLHKASPWLVCTGSLGTLLQLPALRPHLSTLTDPQRTLDLETRKKMWF